MFARLFHTTNPSDDDASVELAGVLVVFLRYSEGFNPQHYPFGQAIPGKLLNRQIQARTLI
jgi:hypothetical protein